MPSAAWQSAEPGNVAASLSKLHPLIADAPFRRQAGATARAAFDRAFTREAMVAAYLNALHIAPPMPEETPR